MISKIQMHGIASYKVPVTLETNKKINIIYGLNGTGKSTLSNYLYNRSGVGYEKCSITVGNDETILVYNQKFIHDHFFEIDNLKGIFSLSKENKEIEQKLENAEFELATLISNTEAEQHLIETEEKRISKIVEQASDKIWEIKKEYSGGDRVLEYCLDNLKGKKETLFNHISNLDKPLTQPNKSISQIKREVEAISGDTAQKYSALPKFSFREENIETNEVLAQIIVGSTDSPVSSLIQKLNNSDWVKKGLEFIPKDDKNRPTTCPFCQEKTITSILERQITEYFDQSYNDSTNKVSELLTKYSEAANELQSLDTYKSNPFTNDYLVELSESHRNIEETLASNISLIKQKEKTPNTAITLVKTIIHIEKFNSVIEQINANIASHNLRIDNASVELISLKKEFWELLRWEYDQTISPCLEEIKASEKIVKDGMAKKLEAAQSSTKKKTEIAELQKSTVNIDKAINSINDGLVQLGITGFSIEKHSDTHYKITRTESLNAVFSSLSEGEKMIISFLYFCELCKGKRSASDSHSKKIVVIDDPVSSLSHIYVYNVGQLIKTDFFSSASIDQIIILTHSLYFFYELTDPNHKRRGETQNLFRLSKNNAGTHINTMKYEEIQNDYHSYWAIINDKNQSPALIANCMRNIIEYFFNFVQKSDLSNVVQKPELRDNKFQSFCRYINRESHSLGQNIFDFKEFN